MLMNKMFKYHKLLFATDLTFSNDPKSHRLFTKGNRAMLTHWLTYGNTLTLVARLPNCDDVQFDVWFIS